MTTTERPAVVDVLRAIDRGAMLPLLPEEEARLLAGPVARAAAGVEFEHAEEIAAARLLQQCRGVLAGPLTRYGIEIPPPPAPVTPRPTTSMTGQPAPVLRVLAGGFIGIYGTPFALREQMKALPGATHTTDDANRACWQIPATPAAAAVAMAQLGPFGPRASKGVLALAEEHAATLAARAVLRDDAQVPEDDGTDYVNMPLWTHQRRFVAFGEETSALLFAVTMGGGKTGATIALANKIKAGRVLIVCPNKVRRVWLREVRERSAVAWHIVDGTRLNRGHRGKRRIDLAQPERVQECTATLFDCDCGAPVHAYAINYEALGQSVWQRWAPPDILDLIVYDEAHKLKNPTAKHRRKIKGVSVEELKARAKKDLPRWTTSGIAGEWRANTRRVIGLTGTPMPQHPWDIFGIYRALDPGIFGTVWTAFAKEYIEFDRTGTFPKKIKPDKLDAFAARVMSIMYRPTVDLKLPGYIPVRRPVELEPDAQKIYDEIDSELWTDLARMLALRKLQRAARAAGQDVPDRLPEDAQEGDAPAELTIANILGRLLRLRQVTGGTLPTDAVEGPDGRPIPGPKVRVSYAKAEVLAEVLEEMGCVAPDKDNPDRVPEPVVVYAQFTEDLTAIREVAEKAGLRYGEISGNRGDGLNDDARMAEDVDVCGVQIQAGGTGIDLTRSCMGVWYSVGYSVSDFDQAKARQYRPGQTRPVRHVHLVTADAVDEEVYVAIDERRDAVAAVLRAGGVEPEEVGVIEEEIDPDPFAELDLDSASVAVAMPWERPAR